MKKKLEADLISIAHRILKLKNKSELIQLHQETQKLYEKLSVLRFVEEHFANVKPTIGLAEIQEKINIIFDEEDHVKEPNDKAKKYSEERVLEKSFTETFIETANLNEEDALEIILEETVDEDINPTIIEEIKIEPVVVEETFFKPAFELAFEAKEEEEKEKLIVAPQIPFEDLLGANYSDPVFVKPEEIENDFRQTNTEIFAEKMAVKLDPKIKSVYDQNSKGIAIGLNDRIAFIKHLFSNNTEDYNRVLSQLITFNTLEETQLFLDEMVKPDYNYWSGKDEYSQRFMEIIEKKFS